MGESAKWIGHYTGIETKEIDCSPVNLYFQRDRKSKKLSFIRASLHLKLHDDFDCNGMGYTEYREHLRIVKWTLGVFIGSQNYGRDHIKGGFQLFTNSFHLGFGKPAGWSAVKPLRVHYSGSIKEPYTSINYILFGRIIFGFDAPKWWQDRKKEEDAKRWAEMPDWEWDDDGTMTNPDQEK